MSARAASSPHAPGAGLPLRLVGDERLALLAGGGSQRAFALIYQRHHQALYRYCRSILRHEHDAQDALQSTMTRALGALARGQRDAPLRPWLFRIAHNESVSILRRRRPTESLDGVREASSPWPEDHARGREGLALLLEDLRELPERQRAALVMRELSGLSHEEIAESLSISVAAAKQAIFEARVGLQDFAEGRGMQCDEVCRAVSDGDGRALRARRIRGHLRSCASCRAFREAMPSRRRELAALAPPLAPAAAAGVLAQLVGGGGGYTGGLGGIATTTAAGKGAGVSLMAKAAAGVVVVATAAVGVTGVMPTIGHPSAISSPRTAASDFHRPHGKARAAPRGRAGHRSPPPGRPVHTRRRHRRHSHRWGGARRGLVVAPGQAGGLPVGASGDGPVTPVPPRHHPPTGRPHPHPISTPGSSPQRGNPAGAGPVAPGTAPGTPNPGGRSAPTGAGAGSSPRPAAGSGTSSPALPTGKGAARAVVLPASHP